MAATSLLKFNQDELGINRQTNLRRSSHGGSTHPNHIPTQLQRQLIDFGSGHSVNPFIISKVYQHVPSSTESGITSPDRCQMLSRATAEVSPSGDFQMETSTMIFKF
jgi:hypothetical protein